MAYDRDHLEEATLESPAELRAYLDGSRVVWINVDGLGNASTLLQIGEQFGLHRLALEDVVNVHQRAKVDVYDDHLFVVTRAANSDGAEHEVTEQISLFFGKNFVLTVQQWPGDSFNPVRDRIRTKLGRIRDGGADYLAYALVDAVVDSYFPIVDRFAEQLDELEEATAADHGSGVMERLHSMRNELLALRRAIRPHRDALNELIRVEHRHVTDETRVFLRDCYDHTVQLIEFLELYREMCAGLRDFQLAMISQKLNEVMKVLTIIATIFIPLSFIAGLYGMNFNTALPGNMPELNAPYAYVGVLVGMAVAAGGMLAWFWRRGWIGNHKAAPTEAGAAVASSSATRGSLVD